MTISALARGTSVCMLLAMLLAGLAGCLNSSPSQALQDAADAELAADEPLTDDQLRDLLDEAIDACAARRMSTKDQAAWQIVHGILAYGPELYIEADGKDVCAIKYLLEGGELNGWRFMKGEKGLDSLLESGTLTGQGHENQWFGYLSQIGIPADQTLVVHEGSETNTYTMQDVIEQVKWTVRDGQEATWTLMGLATYLPLDARWTAQDGSEWTLEKLVGMEAVQNLNESACGGTHRLYGLTSALNRYKNELKVKDEDLTGGWKLAHDVIQESIQTFKEHQQQDGTFSVKFLERSATSPDVSLQLNTSGHTLEFLSIALTDEQLREPWFENAAITLADLFLDTADLPLECGGLYHSAHGLQIYRHRRFGPRPAKSAAVEAQEQE
ncbi:MAG: ADP-ribosylation factor-directed GTPase activating protein isoform b [Pirellulales bacterium]